MADQEKSEKKEAACARSFETEFLEQLEHIRGDINRLRTPFLLRDNAQTTIKKACVQLMHVQSFRKTIEDFVNEHVTADKHNTEKLAAESAAHFDRLSLIAIELKKTAEYLQTYSCFEDSESKRPKAEEDEESENGND